jgi:Major intrinsic protein
MSSRSEEPTGSGLARRSLVEAIGTALLLIAVIGSGIAAQTLSPTDVGLQPLENAIATGAALVAIILAVGPVSGAHLNPIVSCVDAVLGGLRPRHPARARSRGVVSRLNSTSCPTLIPTFTLVAVTGAHEVEPHEGVNGGLAPAGTRARDTGRRASGRCVDGSSAACADCVARFGVSGTAGPSPAFQASQTWTTADSNVPERQRDTHRTGRERCTSHSALTPSTHK